MTNRKLPKDYHDLAQSKGCEWLGPEVNTIMATTWWRCPKKHEWDNNYYSLCRGIGCSVCRLSSGAKEVASVLSSLGIRSFVDKTMPGCTDKVALRFDFCFTINDKTCFVEYDGGQHFKPIEGWHTSEQFKNLQRRDRIKAKFAQDNGFVLIRVRYDVENIRDYLLKQLWLHNLI